MALRAKLLERLEDAANAQPTIRKRKGYDDELVYKVLDVSKMLDNGDGTVIHARPLTSKGAKKPPLGEPLLDIISDNYGTYKVAVTALGRPELAEQWKRLYGGGQATPEGRKSPKKVAATFEENIAEAVNKILEEGKGFLLDVSNLKPLKSGKMGGFRSTNPIDSKTGKEKFGPNYSGGKVGIDLDEIPIISNNYENYAIAVRAIDRDDLADRFAEKHGRNYNRKVVKGASPGKKGAASPGRKRDATPVEKLGEMYNSLELPKYQKDADGNQVIMHHANTGELDVSDLKTNGTGSRIIYRKGGGGANVTKVGVEPLPVVSNNYPTYKLAMNLLNEGSNSNDFTDYAAEYLRLYGQGKGKKSPVVGKKKEKEEKVKGRKISKTGSIGSGSSSSSSSRSRSVSPTRTTRTVVPRRTAVPRTSGRVSPTKTVMPRTVVPRTGRTVVPRTQRARSTSAERAERLENAERLRDLARSRSGSRSRSRSNSSSSSSRSNGLFVIPENSEI